MWLIPSLFVSKYFALCKFNGLRIGILSLIFTPSVVNWESLNELFVTSLINLFLNQLEYRGQPRILSIHL